MTKKEAMLAEQIRSKNFVELKIKEYIQQDVEAEARKFYNNEAKVTLIWGLMACDIYLSIGNEKPKLTSALFFNNWYKIEPEFRDDKLGFGKMLELLYDTYNFVPIDYSKLEAMRHKK